MTGFTGLLSILDEVAWPLPDDPDRLSPGAAADLWEAAQQAVPPRWLAPGHKALWTGLPRDPALAVVDALAPLALADLGYEELKREASIRVLAQTSMAWEDIENHMIFGSDKSTWPQLMTYDEARAKAAELLDNYAPREPISHAR
jgi:hypothetical protein